MSLRKSFNCNSALSPLSALQISRLSLRVVSEEAGCAESRKEATFGLNLLPTFQGIFTWCGGCEHLLHSTISQQMSLCVRKEIAFSSRRLHCEQHLVQSRNSLRIELCLFNTQSSEEGGLTGSQLLADVSRSDFL